MSKGAKDKLLKLIIIVFQSMEGDFTIFLDNIISFFVSKKIDSKYILYTLTTECPKFYRKSVLYMFKYRFVVCLSRCSTDLPKILGHSVYTV